MGGVAHGVERVLALGSPAVGIGIASTIAVPPRRQSESRARRPLDPVDPASARRRRRIGGASTRISCGSSAPSPIPASRAPRVRPWVARPGDVLASDEPQVGRRECQREHDRQAGPGGDPPPAGDRLRPARPARLALSSVRRCGQSSRGPNLASTTGSSVIADQHRDQRDQHPAVAHRAQERQRQGDQREQPDRDGDAAEHHRAAGRLHRPLHRLVAELPCARSSRQRETTSNE